MRRRAERTADVRSKLQWNEPGSKCGRSAARGAAWRAAEIPGVIGGAIDVVEALPVAETRRNIGLADDDCSGGLEPLHGKRVGIGAPVPESRVAPGRRQSGDIELFLDGHRQ